ncbi:hypothetical protein PIB30_071824 [Stylosanthes scabra]|uniref:Uncharacterized protein n=1 Tax=Stylosanthes scabra TaxID=79078 RepID=A0ABU6WM67_9FABA|nr:hypothetical protein [Stylosanthes scabra]
MGRTCHLHRAGARLSLSWSLRNRVVRARHLGHAAAPPTESFLIKKGGHGDSPLNPQSIKDPKGQSWFFTYLACVELIKQERIKGSKLVHKGDDQGLGHLKEIELCICKLQRKFSKDDNGGSKKTDARDLFRLINKQDLSTFRQVNRTK